MVCKHCNSNNEDYAAYCKECGRKLHGIYCPECDTHNEDGTLYCINCGARLDGKHGCLYCGAELEPQALFCPQCGARPDGKRSCLYCGAELNPNDVFCTKCGEKVDTPSFKSPKSASKKNSADLKEPGALSDKPNAFHTVANVLGIVIAALTVIFTLFMGTQGTAMLSSSDAEATGTNIFYYFGKVWSDTDSVASSIPLYNTGVTVLYVKAVMGTVIGAASLIAVLTLSIIAIVKCAKAFKSDKTQGGTAIIAFLIFVAGSLCLLMLDNAFMRIDVTRSSWNFFEGSISRTSTVNAFSKLNALTVTGLIIIGISAIAYVVFAILANRKKIIDSSFGLNGLFVIGSIICAAVIAGFMTSTFISMKNISTGTHNIIGVSVDIKGDMCFNPLDFLLLVADSNDTAISYGDTTRLPLIIALMIIASVFLCVALILAMLIIGFNLKGMTKGKHSKNTGALIMAVFTAALSIAAYVMIKESINMYDAEIVNFNYRFPLLTIYFGIPPTVNDTKGQSIFNICDVSYSPLKVIMIMGIVLLCVEAIRTIANAFIKNKLRNAIEE